MWIFLSITTAVFLSLRDFEIKRRAQSMDPLTLSWSLYLFSIPIMGVVVHVYGVPEFSGWCVTSIILGGGVDALACLLYVKALKVGDLSRSIPMLSFIPVFQLISAPLVLSEYPSALGGVGVLIVVGGAYLINVSNLSGGIWGPFRALFRDRSCQLMFVVALLWSISAVYHKIGVRHYPTYFWVFMISIFNTAVLYPFVHYFSGSPWKKSITEAPRLIIPSVYHLSTLMALYAAFALAQVAYVSSIRRLSILISILLGGYVLKEKNLRSKLVGGVVMVLGAITITLANLR
jgi:uncharacterized membrane protein